MGYGEMSDDEVELRQYLQRVADILYTSGTTGDSKGVMLTYGQYHAAIKANDECVPVTDKDRVIDFLPFTHIFERAWSYLCLSEGARLFINTYPHEIQESMREVHPTCMCSVPRFWEKVYIAVKTKMDEAPSFKKKLFNHALAVGRKRNRLRGPSDWHEDWPHSYHPPCSVLCLTEQHGRTRG